MTVRKIVGKLVAAALVSSVVACYAEANVATEECRTVVVRRPSDVVDCNTRCTDDGCRTHCHDLETWSRQHRCWIEE
jgi:SH3-like domain-containing protein